MSETLDGLLAQNEILQAQLTPDVLKRLLKDLQTLTPTDQEAKLQELLTKAHADADDKIKSLKTELDTLNSGTILNPIL
jgi:DNA-binding protein YbaB